jgi:DNA-binding LytR/AlgR family response regulator
MKVLIIEDEAPAYRRLSKLLKELDRSIEIVGIIQTVKDGTHWLQNNPSPDLILSDIQLADDLSFTIFKELRITTPIIFITAFDEYAINAFKFYSLDYLLKPVTIEELGVAIDKYRTIHQQHHNGIFDAIVKKLSENPGRDRFLVYQGDSLIPVLCKDIAYFMSDNGETVLVTHENKHHFIGETLDSLEQSLNPKTFFRANRQFLLSIDSIKNIHNYGLQKLKVVILPVVDFEIIISKLKATQFKKWLNQ